MLRFHSFATLYVAFACLPGHSQTIPSPSPAVFMPSGPGIMRPNLDQGWVLKRTGVYNDAPKGHEPIYRPVILFKDEARDINASFIIMLNDTKSPDSQGCHAATMQGVMNAVKKTEKTEPIDLKNDVHRTPDGRQFLTTTFRTDKAFGKVYDYFDMHATYGDARNCYMVHISRPHPQAGDEALFLSLVDHVKIDPSVQPSASEYASMAELLKTSNQNYVSSLYAKRAVEAGGSGISSPESTNSPSPLTFAFAKSPGFLSIDTPGFQITELSAKPDGSEYGVRATNRKLGIDALGFLYHPPAKPPMTSGTCMDNQLLSELRALQDQAGLRKFHGKNMIRTASGLDVGLAEYSPTNKKPNPFGYTERVFIAADDVCLDLTFDSPQPISKDTLAKLLAKITFDPKRRPDFFAKFRYATVLFDHKQFAAAAPIFEDALSDTAGLPDELNWRRVVTDQASMAYGISGDLKRSAQINQHAITLDPDYPLYYYNLACADAEAGNADAAKEHLQKAFERKKNTLPGEKLPNPSEDDSFLKLKENKSFWDFAKKLTP